MHNKNLNPLLNLLINCKSAKSAPQILSLIEEYTFLFVIFLIIGLCNSSAKCKFCFVSLLLTIPLSSDFLSKNLYTIEARPIWYPSYLGFLAILNAFFIS